MPPTVRAATKEDAEAVARAYVETWRDAYPGMLPDKVLLDLSAPRHAASWRRRIGEAGEIVVVAEDGAAGIVGFGSAGRARDAGLGHAGEVYTLYLLPDWRDRGLGRALLGALFDALVARGYGSALVWVLADNPSRFFYETMGGRRTAEKVETLWGAPVRQLAYGWARLAEVRV